MNVNTLIAALFPGFHIDEMVMLDQNILVKAHTTSRVTICPNCHQSSERVHSYYTRHPLDLPLAHFPVKLQLRVRRFRCLNDHCVKKTYAERISDWLPVYARRTSRLNEALYHLAQMLGGKGGERLSTHLHMANRFYTLLRLIRRREIAPDTVPRAIGVDDWAIRKGRTYGTIIVDLETHGVIDLLADRTAVTLATWLQERDTIEVVARDRSTDYAYGITVGAPQAMQVADRWHLLQNLSQVVEKWLNGHDTRLKKLPIQIESLEKGTERPPFIRTHGEEWESRMSWQRRQERYAEIQRRRQAGENISQISQALAIHRETVRTYYYAEQFPERQRRGQTPSMLDPYVSYLQKRQTEGCENAQQLWREIQARGYPGKACQVNKWLQPRRTRPAPQAARKRRSKVEKGGVKLPAIRQIVWLLTTPSEKLLTTDKAWVEHLCQDDELSRVYQFAQAFSSMVRERDPSNFERLIKEGLVSGIRELRNFAKGLQIDGAAIRAALQTQWSNGQTEGQVTRLKLLKRQMYGRAKLDLLRYRLMYQA